MRNKDEPGAVLVIEDDPAIRKFACRALELEGYRVLQAEDADEGMRLASQESVSLILLDLRLPGRDGWSLLKELKSTAGLADIPVVVCTASVAVSQKERAMRMGAAGYLKKPLGVASLRQEVKRILGGERGA